MKLPSSDHPSTRRPEPVNNGERGVVLFLFAVALIVVLLATGLAVDLGIAHVTMGRLSKAVDAGALAGAKRSGDGLTQVKNVATRTAAANYGTSGSGAPVGYDVTVDQPATDTYRVKVAGKTDSPTMFARMMGKTSVDVAAVAEATRYPLDISLVLDVSYSLQRNNAFDDMQDASRNFLDHFNDQIDQVGIVGFSTWAFDTMPVRKNFKTLGKSLISALVPLSYTNTEEALRLGKRQLDNAPHRDTSLKLVILFTDGRPTAFADVFRMDGPNQDCATADDVSTVSSPDSDRDGIPDCFGGVVAGSASSGSYGGLWRADNGLKVIGFSAGAPRLAPHSSGLASPRPLRLPGGYAVNWTGIEKLGYAQAEAWASRIRAAGYTIHVVGLGNPNSQFDYDIPDLAFMRRLANEKGVADSTQPKGEMMFAPTPADLDAAFDQLAERILTRLTQ